jgi:hypothetical protein
VGRSQFPEAVVAAAAVTVVAVVGRVLLAALVNVVDVAWTFQPLALPLMSLGVRTPLAVAVWFVPVRVTAEKATVAGAGSVRLPLLQVTGLKVATTAAHEPIEELVMVSLTVPVATPVW